ncbi:MAG: hypothetical protein QOI25_24, partial [Mycobacterium sp.]|nr:hypothetical protein [Mycobacterium sp.]
MSDHPPSHAAEPEHHGGQERSDPGERHGRHELPPDEPTPQIGELQPSGVAGWVRRGRTQLVF